MRTILLLVLSALLATTGAFAKGGGSHSHSASRSSSGTGSKASSTRVRSYTTKKGTHVNPYHRTTPDKTKGNNYSTKGNINPYTGKKGTKRATN
jgi:hypothetical protein